MMNDMKYIRELSIRYPNISSAATEIINLEAIMNLPKGTEHFLSDLHGEYEAFSHIIRNGSGAIRLKIDDQFGDTMSEQDKKTLATLIYYPEQKMDLIEEEINNEEELNRWYNKTMIHLTYIARLTASKYTRSKVRKAMPKEFAYVMEELMLEHRTYDKKEYVEKILSTIVSTGRVRHFIAAMSHLIQRMTIDRLHILGDIYDRGPEPHRIMDCLMQYHNVDIQWGNHDILWMGAASGHEACIANVIRICARYNHLDVLENAYGINLIPLVRLAMEVYHDDSCKYFATVGEHHDMDKYEETMNRRMQKAIAIIQFKLEGQIIKNNPDFLMDDRCLLENINWENQSVTIGEKTYPLLDNYFPTVDSKDPYQLTKEEAKVMEQLVTAFKYCARLQEHVRFLFSKGSLYLRCNNKLLYHGCVPLNEDGSFREVTLKGRPYRGKALYDILEHWARQGFYEEKNHKVRRFGQDIMWYIWSNDNSPVYGKSKMATFERYFVGDRQVRKETKDNYYALCENDKVMSSILREFGLDPEVGRIINGHMPVAAKSGESPMKCNGKVFIIDGGLSKAYQEKTGIAGYTLISNSYELRLIAHEPFHSRDDAIRQETDILSDTVVLKKGSHRKTVGETDAGKEMKTNVADLQELLTCYQEGLISERME